jgi:hypothetical protein
MSHVKNGFRHTGASFTNAERGTHCPDLDYEKLPKW